MSTSALERTLLRPSIVTRVNLRATHQSLSNACFVKETWEGITLSTVPLEALLELSSLSDGIAFLLRSLSGTNPTGECLICRRYFSDDDGEVLGDAGQA